MIDFSLNGSMLIYQYLAGILVVFLGSQIMEGVSTSILSKCMPKTLAIGICNSGFISTQAGTSGRAVGNFSITLAGMNGEIGIENLVFVPLAVTTLVALILTVVFYGALKENMILEFLSSRAKKKRAINKSALK